jgi:hypothetical protein
MGKLNAKLKMSDHGPPACENSRIGARSASAVRNSRLSAIGSKYRPECETP